jgi:hypothetical protein
VPLCLVIWLQQSLRNGLDLGVFGNFHGKAILRCQGERPGQIRKGATQVVVG